MDPSERIAAVEERLARVERVLGLRGPHAMRAAAQGAIPADRVDPPLLGERRAVASASHAPPTLPPTPTPGHTLPPLPIRPVVREVPGARRSGRAAPPTPAPRARGDLEGVVGVAVLGRVGIASLLLAAAYFAQLAYRALSPEMRVAGIYALAAALFAVGAALRSRVAPRYVALLWGGGVAAAYLAGVVAKLRYDLVGPFPAVLMLVGACALGQALARIARFPVLAHVALAGAFTAPLLVGSPTDERTLLLAYVVMLHGWAAWTSRAYGWGGARAIGLAGTAVVGIAWLARWGHVDASTYLHAHGYLLGALLPEIVAGLRGEALGRWRVLGVLLAASIVEIAGVVGILGEGLPAFPVIAGLGWVALAAGWRAAAGTIAPGVKGLARLGGVLLAIGAVTWPGQVMGPDAASWTLVSLAVVSVGAVLWRRALGAGEGTAVLASVFAVLLLSGGTLAPGWTAVALVAPAALLLAGVATPWRQAGLGLALLACFAGLARGGDPAGFLEAFAAAAAVLSATALLARRRGDGELLGAVDVGVLFLGAAWAQQAFAGAFAPVEQALFNRGTAAALALAAAVVVRAPWRRPSSDERSDLRALSIPVLIALVALAGWREVLSATAGLTAVGATQALRTLYVAVASAALLGLGLRAPVARWTALAGLALAAALAIGVLPRPEGLGWAAAGVAGTAGLAFAASRVLPGGGERVAAGALCAVLAFAWTLAGWTHGLEAGVPLANLRFGVGLGLAAALLFSSRRLAERAARLVPWGTGLAVLLAAAIGWVEVRALVDALEAPHARAALGSVYATLACAATLAAGFRTGAAYLRWMGLVGFGAVVGKVGLVDLASVDTPFRVLVTGCLGVVLLLAAYAYARTARARPAGTTPVKPAPAG